MVVKSESATPDIGDLQERLLCSPLFEGVALPLVSAVIAGSETRELLAQEVLLRAGTDNDILYLVLSGRVSVRVQEADQPHVHLGPGECVGELSLLDGGHVSADVVADERTLVLGFDRDQLWPLIESSAEVARNLLRILAGRVRGDNVILGRASRERRHLERLVTVDPLTGLRNRRWLDDTFTRQILRAVRGQEPLALLMIDIDHFKRLNDAHGHWVGDAVLRRAAHVLASGLRPHDLLARYGGEEFAALLPDLEMPVAEAAADRLRRAVEEDGEEGLPRITVSIGVASLEDSDTLAAMLKRADEALYRAKQSGRNGVCA